MHRHYVRALLVLLCVSQLLLSACGIQPRVESELPSAATPEEQLSQLYRFARRSSSPDSENYRIQAAQILMEMNRLDEAADILANINSERLPAAIAANHTLARADLELYRFDGAAALVVLDGQQQRLAAVATANNNIRIRIGQLRAQAHDLAGNFLGSATELIHIFPIMSGTGALMNKERLWQYLLQVPEQQLANTADYDSNLRGWLELAALSKKNQDDLDRQLGALNDWLGRWPAHIAASNLPDELSLLSTMVTERPEKVSLLLPLSGRNEIAGKAILDGFMTTYYAAREKLSYIPQIHIVDTGATTDILQAYDLAVAEGSDFIIGPLDKGHVQQLQALPELAVPTLALNYGIPDLATANLYQFGLAAEDEARQVAEKAWQHGHTTSLVIAPDSPWGQRIAAAFAEKWTEQSGAVLETQYFAKEKNYADAIKELLNIDDSEARSVRVRRIVNQKIETSGRRRTDMDFIFIVATPQQARQIKPTLAFYFAGRIPVYATSHIYGGSPDPLQNRDLDGIIFCETPWMLNQQDYELKTRIHATWPATSDRLGRLYALGVDSYRLLPRIKQMAIMSNTNLFGATGSLALDEQRRVVRTLRWAKIQKGTIRTLN